MNEANSKNFMPDHIMLGSFLCSFESLDGLLPGKFNVCTEPVWNFATKNVPSHIVH